MSNDLATGIASWLSNAWRFFTEVTIPGTSITFGVLAIGLAVIPIGFRFLSLMAGHNIGETGFDKEVTDYGTRGSKKVKISNSRKNDVR